MFAVVGLLSAVMNARATDQGQTVDVYMVEGTAVLSSLFHGMIASGLWSHQRGSNLIDGSAPFYRCYACADGGHVAVGALEPQFFALLLDGLGIARDRFIQHDRDAWPEMTAAFEAAFLTRSRDEWAQAFEGVDACVSPVLSFAEAADHPHNRARGVFPTVNGVRQPAVAPRFSTGEGTIAPGSGPIAIADVLARWRG
jgi:alpha-methylacyl-CoA racemase